MNILEVKKLNEHAVIPTRAHSNDAGLDLYCSQETFVPVGETVLVHTHISVNIPNGYYGQLFDRSGCALKGLSVGGGVLDAGYLGEISVIVTNMNNSFNTNIARPGYKISLGDRIAQLVLFKCELPKVVEVDYFEQTERGNKGFNSSGK